MNRDNQEHGGTPHHNMGNMTYSNVHTSGSNANHSSLDYDSWVSSIQDGFFQATPMTSHILQQSTFMNSVGSSGSIPLGGINLLNTAGQPGVHDFNMDLALNTPERLYRDIINESPVLSRTPQIGRTPLRSLNMNMNISTPNFLKNIETTNFFNNNFGSATKTFTPLKNQLFASNEMFQTPRDTSKDNSGNIDSSPTTIQMNSSAVKESDAVPNVTKILPPSPTPGSMMGGYKPIPPNSSIPKMGCFKKIPTQEPPKKSSKPQKNSTIQIIMTDVNSFANNSKPTRSRKKKLTRSSTATNIGGSVKKKSSLKRTLSQPQAKIGTMIGKDTLVKTQTPVQSNVFENCEDIPSLLKPKGQ